LVVLEQKRGRPPGSKNTKNKMEQKMELVHQRLALLDSSSGSDRDDDIGPRVRFLHYHFPLMRYIHCCCCKAFKSGQVLTGKNGRGIYYNTWVYAQSGFLI
jgi:hypothetical protein